ncbi:hypothetical protein [uncultured Winogradskyella sp.]|uniref:hypothetical protein n=1 Tax=uncultured Winogradskyella sp. TaxID=395353 RepID=UPI0030DA91A9
MKNRLTFKSYLLYMFLMIYGITFGQKKESCKVLLTEISDSYKGDCKDGLADGKGRAKGIDVYKGKFKNGLPDGKGKYEYENGNVFTGKFKNGLKHGEGKFVYSLAGNSYTQKGYWVNGDYVGLSNPELSHRIIMKNGVDKIDVNKLSGDIEKIKVSFYALLIKYVPLGLKISSSSGQVTQTGQDFFITNSSIGPNFIDIEYIVKKAGQNKICLVSFEIIQRGNYEVVITNE